MVFMYIVDNPRKKGTGCCNKYGVYAGCLCWLFTVVGVLALFDMAWYGFTVNNEYGYGLRIVFYPSGEHRWPYEDCNYLNEIYSFATYKEGWLYNLDNGTYIDYSDGDVHVPVGEVICNFQDQEDIFVCEDIDVHFKSCEMVGRYYNSTMCYDEIQLKLNYEYI